MMTPHSPTFVLIDILGAVALLLWGLRLVRTGVFRACGASLRRWVGQGTRNRVMAFLAGFGVTLGLQSSTATALMASAMSGQGLMTTAMALAVMLGADVGTSVVAGLLSLDVRWLAPALLLLGSALFAVGEGSRQRRAVGRTFVGLGLMLLALRLLAEATVPIRESGLIHAMLGALTGEPALALLVAAGLTALLHSSLAVVLLIASLAGGGLLDMAGTAALVLGANLGGAAPPLVATAREVPAGRRVPLGNLLMRAGGALAALPFVEMLPGTADAHAAVLLHAGFNGALAALFIPLVGPVARLTERMLPDRTDAEDPGRPRHLDESVLEAPTVAIACAVRETLRLGDLVEGMLRRTLDVLRHDDERMIAEVSRTDDAVDALHTAIKLYLIKVGRGQLEEEDSRRVGEIMAFAINLEHIGDIVDKSLVDMAAKKTRLGLRFPPEDFQAIEALHRRTLDNLRTALGIFLSEDLRLARQLIAEKDAIRTQERASAEAHLTRVREGRTASIETSALTLDLLRDLKRINAHAASVAYPILKRAGELSETRLKEGGLLPVEKDA